jgi:hypothetical protein
MTMEVIIGYIVLLESYASVLIYHVKLMQQNIRCTRYLTLTYSPGLNHPGFLNSVVTST